MRVKIKLLNPLAQMPRYAKDGDAGLDLTVVRYEDMGSHVRFHFGIAMEIPEGYVGLIFARSSIYKRNMMLPNGVGVIDSGYRGEIMAVMRKFPGYEEYTYGNKAAQLIILPYPKIEFVESDYLSETDRGKGGYGSTG